MLIYLRVAELFAVSVGVTLDFLYWESEPELDDVVIGSGEVAFYVARVIRIVDLVRDDEVINRRRSLVRIGSRFSDEGGFCLWDDPRTRCIHHFYT